ncbi:MAG: hypothetical protein JWQ87_12, partial [Candidatus Sulfotelmatobacter sp.]|nr:hypothetical protein [Candidatus Sulfotelmatobacter sp.]
MSQAQDYKKLDPNGNRFDFGGINTVSPPDAMPPKKYPMAVNIRRYLHNQIISRATQTAALFTALSAAIHSLRRMNDTTASGPVSGYVLISGSADKIYATAAQVASGLSGNRLSMVPFRPNASPQPWMYVSDSSPSATLTASGFACAGMIKVRSDGLTYKTGIMEPQQPPTVVAQNAIVNGNVSVPSTTKPWNVSGGQNAGYPYTATGGTASVVITCAAGATIQLTATGTIVTSYSGAAGAGDLPPSNGQATNYPGGQGNIGGSFCNVLMGAFTDSSGNVVTPTTGTGPVTIGAGPTTLLVPTGATQLQLGIDDVAYGSGSGNFNVAYTVTTQAVASNVSLLGNVTTYFWGDSPHSGPVAAYIWNNPSDVGTHPRTISTATGSVTNNSLIFDSPTLGSGTVPMQWTTLDSTGAVVGSQPVFTAPLEPEGFQDFNMVVTEAQRCPDVLHRPWRAFPQGQH